MSKIIARGKGNHRNVTTQRVRPLDVGLEIPEEGGAAFKVTDTVAEIGLSAGATAAVSAVVSVHVEDVKARPPVADAVILGAQTWAKSRGAKRVWDIDVAATCGFPMTPEGAEAFRKAVGLRAPSVPWPTKVSETPDAKTTGLIVDPATGATK